MNLMVYNNNLMMSEPSGIFIELTVRCECQQVSATRPSQGAVARRGLQSRQWRVRGAQDF